MEIQTIENLVDHIYAINNKEEAIKAIKTYGDIRCEDQIEKAWDRASRFYKTISKLQKKRVKNAILNYDEENGFITLKEFLKYYFAVDDQLHIMMKYGDDAHKDAASDISSTLSNSLGDIRVDRRMLFPKDRE